MADNKKTAAELRRELEDMLDKMTHIDEETKRIVRAAIAAGFKAEE